MDVTDIEIGLLLEGIFRQYGFDFREYAESSIRRRILSFMEKEGKSTVSGLQESILHSRVTFERFLKCVTVNVTSMFRNPSFYRTFRDEAVPLLRTYPFIRIWVAGCSSGEELYSLAIVLKEEGLYEKTRIYATDLSELMIGRAQKGIFPMGHMQEFTRNYLDYGGRAEFSNYYTAHYDNAIFSADLNRNVVYSKHNLVSDSSFNEFHVIFCRNVMIYFNRALQDRVLKLLAESNCIYGFLGIGNRESLRYSSVAGNYQEIGDGSGLYRRAV